MTDRFASGDALRGVAALMVVVAHVAQGSAQLGAARVPIDVVYGANWGRFFSTGLIAGLYLFFALSGFVLSRPFLAPDREVRLPGYLRNRALRILPALWVLVAFVLLRHGTLGSSPAEVLAVPALLQSFAWSPFADLNFHVWSLNTEALFYLLVPLVFLVRGARPRVLLGALAVIYVAALGWHAAGTEADLGRRAVAIAFYGMAPGVALAVLEPHVRPRAAGARKAIVLLWAYAAFALVTLVLTEPNRSTDLQLRSTGTAAVLAAVLLHEWRSGRPYRLLATRALHWLGERSYAVYLWHVAVALELGALVAPIEPGWRTFAVMLVLTVAGTCAVAALSFRFVEQPFLRRRRRWDRAGPE